MIQLRRVSLFVLLSFALPSFLFAAADLPPWSDDSGISITAWPSRFSPARGTTNLVGRVFHPIDSAARIVWSVTIVNPEGQALRHFSAAQTYVPGEAMLLSVTWNGRDDLGRLLPDGRYEAIVDVVMRAVGERVKPRGANEDIADREAPSQGVDSIHQRFSGYVIVDSSLPGRHARAESQTPHDPGVPYNFYYGTLHNQTSFTDGGHPNDVNCASSTIHGGSDFDPAAAYNYARNTGRLDFMAIQDHNHLFDNACSGCTGAQVIQRYHTGLSAAATATVDGSFVGIYGMEWGYISNPDAGFPNEGHVGVLEAPKLFGWETGFYEVLTPSGSSGYAPMYTTALANSSVWGAFGQFNHPSDGTKSAANQGLDYNSLQYTTDGDDFIHTIAVISGPATDPSTTTTDTGALYAGEPVNGPSYSAYTSTDMYNRALGAGFHVAPAADPDVHCSNYGTSTRDRTVILSASLTKAALFDALHNRRVYATSDANTQLVYTMNANATTYYMGAGGIRTAGPINTSGSITLHTSVWDPDAGEFASSIKIKEPVPGNTNGAETVIATSTSSPFDYTFTPSTGKHTYYVYVTLNTGDRLFSAPIWINQGGTPDTTAPTTSITAPANGATVSGTTSVTASASDNVGVTKVEFYLDSVLQSTSTASPYTWSWNTTTATNASHSLTSKAYDAAANVGTSAVVTVTVSNVADTTAPTTSITAPANGATVSGTASVTASASDNVGVTKVEFYLDSVLQSTSTASPYTWSWNTTTATNASHSLTSKAYDAAANVGTSAIVTVTVSNVVDTTPPTAPTNLAAVSSFKRKINLTWTASTDNVGVSGYQIWRATISTGPFSQIATSTVNSYTNSGLTSGTTYYYYVIAYDAAGNVSAASNTASTVAK